VNVTVSGLTHDYSDDIGLLLVSPASFPSAPKDPYGSSLSDFNGSDPNGTWKLYVIDASRKNAGSITG
jgi:subtilisin-like proprotein convertase family protein